PPGRPHGASAWDVQNPKADGLANRPYRGNLRLTRRFLRLVGQVDVADLVENIEDPHAAFDRLVDLEMKNRSAAEDDPLHHDTLNEAPLGIEFADRLASFLGIANRSHIDLGGFQINRRRDVV